MSDRARQLTVVVIDIAMWATAAWAMTLASDPMARAKLYWNIAHVASWCARRCGECAITAELAYHKEVQSL